MAKYISAKINLSMAPPMTGRSIWEGGPASRISSTKNSLSVVSLPRRASITPVIENKIHQIPNSKKMVNFLSSHSRLKKNRPVTKTDGTRTFPESLTLPLSSSKIRWSSGCMKLWGLTIGTTDLYWNIRQWNVSVDQTMMLVVSISKLFKIPPWSTHPIYVAWASYVYI